jgi:Fur family zinc uptake transcriptional regulator
MALARSHRSHAAPADPAHDHRLCVADALSVADRVCEQRSIRFTDLRRRVFELVWASHKPVGAYAILETLRAEGLGSAPPTVYRALDFLLEHELVHRIESLNAFVGCAHPGESHRGFFLICTKCGNAEELDDERLNATIAHAAEARGFTARHTTLEVAGTCASCRTAA